MSDYENPGRDIGYVERKAHSRGYVRGVTVTAIVAIVCWIVVLGGLVASGHLR